MQLKSNGKKSNGAAAFACFMKREILFVAIVIIHKMQNERFPRIAEFGRTDFLHGMIFKIINWKR